jgi:adenosylcobinamide kinase/adenosylcobinamide-phosphate guanylyltransferase
MKTLFIGGVKSGKSLLAERHLLLNLPRYAEKPYYLATTEFLDEEMRQRIKVHQQRRQEKFITIEEPVKLYAAIKRCEGTILVECVSMWLNNMLHHKVPEANILRELEAVLSLPRDLVLVHNEVGFGVIPDNELARQFVDLSGKAAQLMGQQCDKVFFCSAGLTLAMK